MQFSPFLSTLIRATPEGSFGVIPTYVAVSYTHLDVYKRQVDGLQSESCPQRVAISIELVKSPLP